MLKSIKRILQHILNQHIRCYKVVSWVLFPLLLGCSASKSVQQYRFKGSLLSNSQRSNHFTGLLIVDPVTNDTLIGYNADKYFTPASTTKIFTLYTALKLLPERLPTLKYIQKKDTLFVEGTGDPTLLHPDFEYKKTLTFLKNHKNIALNLNNYIGGRYRPGWAWEDFDTYFSPEIGPFPLYGNVITVLQTDSLQVSPTIFTKKIIPEKRQYARKERENLFYIPNSADTLLIPYINSKDLTKKLLGEATFIPITLVNQMPKKEKKTFWGIPSDTLYKKMMHKSDNFIAEQIMLMVSSQLSDTLGFKRAKDHILKNHLFDLKQKPRWVDGSGLSRYNLFTPNSMVDVLRRLYEEFPQKRLFGLFPRWDASRTPEADEQENSFIIAKSGSLGNNYNLCGYLVTKSGKLLVFSFMNNHFTEPTRDIRQDMYRVLKSVRDSN